MSSKFNCMQDLGQIVIIDLRICCSSASEDEESKVDFCYRD